MSRVVIHLGARSCDAMYRVQESKSKLELFYRLFTELFCRIFLALGNVSILFALLITRNKGRSVWNRQITARAPKGIYVMPGVCLAGG